MNREQEAPTPDFILETLQHAHDVIGAHRSSTEAYYELKLFRLRAINSAKEIVNSHASLQEENKQLTEALEISEKDLTTVIAERDEFMEENKRLREGLTEWQYRLSLDPKSTATDEIILRLSCEPMFEPADCSGEVCLLCGEQIFGRGFNVVISTMIEGHDLPRFRPTTAHYCQSCKPDFDSEK